MTEIKHEWNVVIVNKHGMPRKHHVEFQVSAPSFAEAASEAKNVMAHGADHVDWKIKAIWWMDPKRVKKEVG